MCLGYCVITSMESRVYVYIIYSVLSPQPHVDTFFEGGHSSGAQDLPLAQGSLLARLSEAYIVMRIELMLAISNQGPYLQYNLSGQECVF